MPRVEQTDHNWRVFARASPLNRCNEREAGRLLNEVIRQTGFESPSSATLRRAAGLDIN